MVKLSLLRNPTVTLCLKPTNCPIKWILLSETNKSGWFCVTEWRWGYWDSNGETFNHIILGETRDITARFQASKAIVSRFFLWCCCCCCFCCCSCCCCCCCCCGHNFGRDVAFSKWANKQREREKKSTKLHFSKKKKKLGDHRQTLKTVLLDFFFESNETSLACLLGTKMLCCPSPWDLVTKHLARLRHPFLFQAKMIDVPDSNGQTKRWWGWTKTPLTSSSTKTTLPKGLLLISARSKQLILLQCLRPYSLQN